MVYCSRVTAKISTIICCYNQADYVAQAIESVLQQTHQNVELIVIDNGSSDGSPEAMRRFSKDPRVTLLLHAKNEAISKRMNEGIERSTGEFLSILYADDYYLPAKFERQLACFDRLGPDYGVVYSPGFRLNIVTQEKWVEPSMTRSGSILDAMLAEYHTHGFINPISPLIRREVAKRFKFREELFTEGEVIYFRYALAYKFHFLDEPLVVMRDHANNMGKAIKKNMAYFMDCLDRLAVEPEFPPSLIGRLSKLRTDLFRNYGWQALRMAEDPAWARQCFRRAVAGDRNQIMQPKIALGFCLALLPRPFLHGLNLAANALSNSKLNGGFKEDYA